VRDVQFDGSPDHILPTLGVIWASTFARDTAAFADALMSHHWCWLGADATADTESDADEHPVPGVGLAMTVDGATGPTVLATADIGRLPGDWVYLIDPDTAAIAVYSHGQPVTARRLQQ
jgi:hypothetical protein